ncbi:MULTISPECIES: tripartite tricarboxylate transporter substrate binding protein [unclassified Variovorax]|uniref:Bug family tripartite tricarboxylate transporter substrate binding protein n=1 Tax=unclassified Variovorax TaxID=663243 RepID=UPI001BD23969|nr:MULTISPECIES: tripartite tricarboxylate transporter substrate binding protein [unclassified Variovorax]
MVNRRDFCLSAMAATSLAATWQPALAGDYPDRPIRLIVGFPAGQSTDTSARRIAQSMSQTLGRSVFVDNRPGAAGIISHEAVKNAPADGYTLLMGSTGTLAINPWLYQKLPYDPIKDFEPVASVSASPLVLFTSVDSPVKNLKQLIALAKSRPGKLSYGSSGNGTTGHIAMEMLKKEAGIELLHVPYKGSPPMITDVMGGQVNVAFDTAGAVLAMVKGGRIQLLGIATLKRFEAAPDLPTLAEQGLAGFEAMPWSAILAPKGTPAPIVQRLNTAVNAALKDPVVLDQFVSTGSYALGGPPPQLQAYLAQEHARWGKAVVASGARVD